MYRASKCEKENELHHHQDLERIRNEKCIETKYHQKKLRLIHSFTRDLIVCCSHRGRRRRLQSK